MRDTGEAIDGLLSCFSSCSLPRLGTCDGGVCGGRDNFDGPLFFAFFRFLDAIVDFLVVPIARIKGKDGDGK